MDVKLGQSENDKSRITSIEIKIMRRTAKYTWQDYKNNEDILSEFKINAVVKKTHMYRNKWIQHVQQMDRGSQPHLIMKFQPCGK